MNLNVRSSRKVGSIIYVLSSKRFTTFLSKTKINNYCRKLLFQNCRRNLNLELMNTSSRTNKRPFKKRKTVDEQDDDEGLTISAFGTAEEFDFETLKTKLNQNFGYELSDFNKKFSNSENVLHLAPHNSCETNTKDVFIFREGSVVLWNISDSEILKILNSLKEFQKHSFSDQIVHGESEMIKYVESLDREKSCIMEGKVILAAGVNSRLEKFAISNAMALSVHLGAYESILDEYIDSMSEITENLRVGKITNITQNEVLKKMGQLFALRHNINLSSDLLDTPDFYWEHEELENLYYNTFSYYAIGKRTKVMNEKINHCVELVELLSTKLSDKHHIRLEWMIIILIMVEVGFEFLHYAEKYWAPLENAD